MIIKSLLTSAFQRKFNGRYVTEARAVILIETITAPGAKLQLCENGETLSQQGQVPFRILARLSSLRLKQGNACAICDQESAATLPAAEGYEVEDNDAGNDTSASDSESDDSDSEDEIDTMVQSASEANVDGESKRYGLNLLKPTLDEHNRHSHATSRAAGTRIIQDVWHALKRIPVPRKHGLRREFQRTLTNTVLLMDDEDVAKVKSVLERNGEEFDTGIIFHVISLLLIVLTL